jgi:hypothetical protein
MAHFLFMSGYGSDDLDGDEDFSGEECYGEGFWDAGGGGGAGGSGGGAGMSGSVGGGGVGSDIKPWTSGAQLKEEDAGAAGLQQKAAKKARLTSGAPTSAVSSVLVDGDAASLVTALPVSSAHWQPSDPEHAGVGASGQLSVDTSAGSKRKPEPGGN